MLLLAIPKLNSHRTVLRELLQNAADASASKVSIKFETLPSSTVPLPSKPSPSALIKHTILHHTIKRMIVSNDGHAFGPNDWSRLKRIAEGNPDETKIGAFGVGFYSVFSDCEEPFISSGREAMAFYWKENTLFTRKLQLPETQAMTDTTFVLDYRNSTTTIPPLLSLCQFLASSLTFVGLSNIELWLDGWKLLSINKTTAPGANIPLPRSLRTRTLEGLMEVQSVVHETSQLSATWLKIVGWNAKATTRNTNATGSKSTQNSQSLRSFFSRLTSTAVNAAAEKVAQEERVAQEAIAEDFLGQGKATVFLHVNTAQISAHVNKSFGMELERATKKPPPKSTRLAVLTASYDETQLAQSSADPTARAIDIFASVLPTRSGRIFIGFPTHQTTGLAAHISAPSVIPTVERESIDLNARWVRTWNEELLRAAGIVCRVAWMGENQGLKQKLSDALASSGNTKVRETDVEKVLSHAIHNLAQFSFTESTPWPQVGGIIEEAFWMCDVLESIEILSSRGVLACQQVRLATDELSFVEGIPTLPKPIIEKASAFVKKLITFGIITEVTMADIAKELEKQALNSKQLVEFLRWLAKTVQTNDVDAGAIKSLLDVTVANDDENNKVILLSQIKYFLNPSKIPIFAPVPPQTLPFKFTKDIQKPALEKLGWEDLQIVPWAKFLLEEHSKSSERNFETDAVLACLVLPAISKQWDGLGQGSKTTLINLLAQKTVIPTKQGMRRPAEAYFPTVKLFDDLPIVTVNNVKEKMLTALGVRKTVDLNLVFARLLSGSSSEEKGPTWSHVDLIKYFVQVRNDIPKDDIKKLQNTPICTIQSDPKGQRYKVTEVFEPNDDLRLLGFKVLVWPGLYKANSEEGKFLKSLGLRSAPTAFELIDIMAKATSEVNLELREQALRYLLNHYHQHGYSSSEISASSVPFLPLENRDKVVSVPSKCFTNPNVALLGYEILRHDLHPNAARLGVRSDPPMSECVNWLIRNPPQNHRSARQVFEYFASRLNELGGEPREILSTAEIVPIVTQSSEKSQLFKHIAPTMCFLGSGGKYAEILDYVDFSDAANSFLIRCGSKPEPSSLELAKLVVSRPARIFSTFGNPEKYQALLSTIAEAWPTIKKDKSLVRAMKSLPFLIAYKEVSIKPSENAEHVDADEEENRRIEKTYQLALAKDTVVLDQVVNYSIFKSHILAVPTEEDLENFYLALGAVPLSSIVEESPQIGRPNRDQIQAERLKELVEERMKLFLYDIPKEQVKRDAEWISRDLKFIAVPSIQVYKSLKGRNVAPHIEHTNAIYQRNSSLGPAIFFTPGMQDLFDVSQAILMAVLNRPKANQAIILTTLLDTSLEKLRLRGYDVSRILKKRQAAIAKIAEEERVRRLEEEQRRSRNPQGDSYPNSLGNKKQTMPGVFPESPDYNSKMSDTTTDAGPIRSEGIVSQFLGAVQGTGRGLNDMMASYTRRPQLPEQPSNVVNPEHLSRKLKNAIKASRPHTSPNLVSDPVVNDVAETKTFCDAKPGQNIMHADTHGSGLKLFLPNDTQDKPRAMRVNFEGVDHFAVVVLIIAEVLKLPKENLHLFWDKDSSTIAFNSNGALFLNHRYFKSLHFTDLQQNKPEDAIIYWFVILCHELAHNIVADHSAAHSYYTYA